MNYRKVKYVVLFSEDRMASGVFHNLDDVRNTYRGYPLVCAEVSESSIRVQEANGTIHKGTIHKVESFL